MHAKELFHDIGMVGEKFRRGDDDGQRKPLLRPQIFLLADDMRPGLGDQERAPRLRRPGGVDLPPDHHAGLLGVGDRQDVVVGPLMQHRSQEMAGGEILRVPMLRRRQPFAAEVA